jgi:hypothetical protein
VDQWDLWVGMLHKRRVMGHKNQLGLRGFAVVKLKVVAFELTIGDHRIVCWVVGLQIVHWMESTNFVNVHIVVIDTNL